MTDLTERYKNYTEKHEFKTVGDAANQTERHEY